MSFLNWAIDRAQKEIVDNNLVEYGGKKYKNIIKTFTGTLSAGRVRALKKEFGEHPVNDELRQVACKWGGNYRSESCNVRVSESVFIEVA